MTIYDKKNLLTIFFILIALSLFSKDIICDYCHKPITGEYVKVGNKYYHPQHFKCAHCHKAIKDGSFIEYNGKYYCEDCFYKYVVPKCSYCGKPLKGKYAENFWGEKYHFYHEKEYPKCEYCGRLVTDHYKDSNGFDVCKNCRRHIISNEIDLNHWIDNIVKKLYKHNISIDMTNVKIHLSSMQELKRISNDSNLTKDSRGLAKEVDLKTESGKIIKRNFDIYLLRDMPDYVFAEVAAHELMHIWIYLNGQIKQEPALVEGSCNYAAYLVVNDFKNQSSFEFEKISKKNADYIIMKLVKNPDPIYGEGFRRMKKYAEKFGNYMWLSYIKKHKNLPKNF